ncbi:MAG: HAMP domain-containing sensor histidine kinase [Clostridiaceae bacterium]|nr:HAMP domain-containing sensor histidine kinase [Clostridiaceae bacterium]
MDIRSKDIRYAAGTKIAAVVLVWICFVSAVWSLGFLFLNQEVDKSNSYYDSYRFKDEFSRLIHNTVEANIKLKSIENINASGGTVGDKARNIERYHNIKSRMSNTVNYLYYINNSSTGEAITNVAASQPKELIKKQPVNASISRWNWESKVDIYTYGGEIEEMLRGTEYEVYAAIQEPLKPGDVFYDDFKAYSRTKEIIAFAYPVMFVSLILLIIVAAYLSCVTGRRERGGEIVLSGVDNIYTDVHTLLVLIAAALSLTIAVSSSEPNDILTWVIPLLVLGVDGLIGISYVLSMIRQAKAGRIFKNTLIYNLAKLCFDKNSFKPSIILFLLGYGLINGILFDIGVDLNQGDQEPVFTILLIVFNTAAVYFTARALTSLSKIMNAAKEISSGNLDYELNSSEISVAFSGMATNIANIQGGLKKAVEEAIKGERMKTDLITNVSHDLKTPLTSIISYVDLLKNEELNNERAEEYVNILEEKGARMKQLVEDLVEASKASSGNLPVNAEKVDLHELVLQACGEYEEKITEAELDLRINAEEKNIFVYADGKQMWRIIENLLLNAIKYSMPQSRMYINLTSDSNYGSFTVKNISALPLDIPPEQLTERFVRGDVSRTTEGSGLGLSIAQSLTALQGGKFKIEIDGDLFKVSVDIPLWAE